MHRAEQSRVHRQLGEPEYQAWAAAAAAAAAPVWFPRSSPFPNCWRPALPNMGCEHQLRQPITAASSLEKGVPGIFSYCLETLQSSQGPVETGIGGG